jgi:predicted phosphodiesterase
MPRISDLTPADRLSGSEETALTQGGITKRAKKTDFAWQIQAEDITVGDGLYTSIGRSNSMSRTHDVCILGDFTSGYNGSNATAVKDLITSYTAVWGVSALDYVLCVGDVSDTGPGEDITTLLSDWNTITSDKIISAAGNHDYDDGITNLKTYSEMTNFAETYFSIILGDAEFFFVDSNSHADNNLGSADLFRASTMGQWVEGALADSQATWKIVIFHHPAYSSGATHGSTAYMQLDWAEMGAHVVISGHDHVYERLHLDNVVYLTAGTSGAGTRAFATPLATSVARESGASALGITFLSISPDALQFEFFGDATSSPKTLDKFRLVKL